MNWTKLFACGTLTPSGLQGIPWRPVGGLACYTHVLIWTEQGTICVIPQTFVLMLASHSVYFPAQNHAMRQYLIYAWWSWWKKVWDLQQVQKMRLFYTRNYDVIYWMSYNYNMTVWHFGPCVTFRPCLCDISARLVWHFGPLVRNEGKRVSPYPHINHRRRL